MGFDVRELPFAFSAFPGFFATPLIGALAAAVVVYACVLGAEGSGRQPLILLLTAEAVLIAVSFWLLRAGVLRAPLMRRGGVNLEATRGNLAPAVWLCAHLDSKSQPVPTLIRGAGMLLEGAGYVAAELLAIAAAMGAGAAPAAWSTVAAVTLAGAIPVVLSVVGRQSCGALDNASGVAAVLAVARELCESGVNAGVLLTDAEELGLAGASAWAERHRGEQIVVLNCDGVDDDGGIRVMYHGWEPGTVLAAVERASADSGIVCTVSRVIPTVLTDAAAFTRARLPSVTFSRGTLRTLRRIHTGADDLARLRGTGIARTAGLMNTCARLLARND